LDFPFHVQLQKVGVELAGWLLEMILFDKNLVIPTEKVNKIYRLPIKRLY
jgi:hypothetical protein